MINNTCSFARWLAGTGTPFQDLCQNGASDFNTRVLPVIKIRQKIGSLKQKHAGGPIIDKLKKQLAQTASLLDKKYQEELEGCQDNHYIRSCGFIEAYDSFITTFGQLGHFKNDTRASVVINTVPLMSGFLVGDIELQDKKTEVVFDTGCSYTAFSKSCLDLHLDNFTNIGNDSNFGLPLFLISDLKFNIGRIPFFPEIGVYTPLLDFIEGSSPEKISAAMMGLDFLLTENFIVNYDSSQIVFNVDIDKELSKRKWKSTPIKIHFADPLTFGLEVFINGRPFTMLFDTGGNRSFLTSKCSSKLSNPKYNTKSSISKLADGKDYSSRNVTNVDVKLMGHKVSLPRMNISSPDDPSSQKLSFDGYCGVLGLDVIKNFNFILDSETFTLYISPRETKTYQQKSLDFIPARGKDGIFISSLIVGGKAEKAGLKQGDVIIEINGAKISEMTIIQFFEVCYSDTKIFSVFVRRNGERKDFVIETN